MVKLLTALVIGLVLIAPSYACRPLVTDDCPIVDPGKWEIESGYTAANPRGGAVSTNGLNLQIKRGMFQNFDFAVETPYRLTGPIGLQDAVLHFKYKLLGREGLTLRGDVKLTNEDANQGLGSGYADYTIFLINSSSFGIFSIHTNLLYSFIGVAPGFLSANFIQASIAGEYPTREDKLNIVTEIVWNNSTAPNPVTLLLGGYYYLIEELRIDAGLTVGITESASQSVATFGLTKEL
ncbi:MAG: hypothetical protein FD145_1385 [Candidatus Saganbacteria bacterium]|uniref:Transporter n=1 Tax=Candidatus Saganbacteria bacterium TaxID=2575572 RepID=A0A833L040_UNCSA|nr:MAG: hypothetical protein FD145_1385 [Candidatus Saganbacteria bacterium]